MNQMTANLLLMKHNFSPSNRKLTARAGFLLMGLYCSATVLFQSGCASHLHNPANLALSRQAQEQLDALQKANGATFDSMYTNLATFSRINADLYEDLALREAQTHARLATTELTWGDLRNGFGPGNPLSIKSKELTSKMKAINEELKRVGGESKEALKLLNQAGNELNAAKATVTSWNRRVAVLDKIIESTPSIKEALGQVKSPDDFKSKVESYGGTLKKKLDDVQVVYLDADGKGQTNSLSSELENMLGEDSDSHDPHAAGKIRNGISSVFNPKSPGLVITAAALAKDLAEAESGRLSLQLDSLQNRLSGLQQAEKVTTYGMTLATRGSASIPKKDFPDAEPPTASLEKLRHIAKANLPEIARVSAELAAASEEQTREDLSKKLEKLRESERKISSALEALSFYVTINSECIATVEEALLNDAYLQHVESIRVSQINLRQRESMAARGVESLVVYHGGGIKSEEIAEMAFKVVQLGLLTWIGAGIN